MSAEKPYAMRHRVSGLYLAKRGEGDPDPYKYAGAARTIGARGHYKWVPNIEDAIHYPTEDASFTDWLMMGEPPVDFIDVEPGAVA